MRQVAFNLVRGGVSKAMIVSLHKAGAVNILPPLGEHQYFTAFLVIDEADTD